MKYKDQAIWFMNGFWHDLGPDGARQVHSYIEHFIELDKLSSDAKGKDGCELDQFWSAKFLEDKDTAMTATQRKEALRTIDQDNNGKMAAIEYLIWKYKKTVDQVMAASQGDNREALAAAQAKLDAVQQAIADLQPKLKAAQEAYAIVKAAEDEVAAAVAELKAQEDAYANKCKELEAKSKTGGVAGARAANELAQLKGEDPLPLRKAKITQEAALRKAEKARKAAEEPKLRLEEAYTELEAKMEAARQELEEVKRMGGPTYGAFWWMERELFEADKSLPRAKQKYDHSKPFHYDPTQ